MGVYLPNMEMPKSCAGCALYRFGCTMEGKCWNVCAASGKDLDNPFGIGVPARCPLIEVPEPHGDLIDRDKLRAKEFIHDGDTYAVVMSRDIRNAPTIIEAEEGET